MDDYSTDENILKQNSHGPGKTKRVKKVRKQVINNERSSQNSTDQPTVKRQKRIRKTSNTTKSTDKSSEILSETNSISQTNSLSADRSHTKLSLSQSNQINSSELNTESSLQDFSSDLSQKVPTYLPKENWGKTRERAVQNIKPVETANIMIIEDSSYSQDNQKSTKKMGNKKKPKKSLSSQNAEKNMEKDNTQKQPLIKLPGFSQPPRRRDLFDREDIDKRKNANVITINPSTDKVYSDEYSSMDQDDISSTLLNQTSSSILNSDEINISQAPLPNESDFKKLQNDAVLSIRSTNVDEKSASISNFDYISKDLVTTSASEYSGSDLSQVSKSKFRENTLNAIREIKESKVDIDNNDDEKTFSNSDVESIPVDLTNSQKKETKNIGNNHFVEFAPPPQSRPPKSFNDFKSNKNNNDDNYYLEEEEEEDAANESSHSQIHPTVDNLSEKFDENSEELNSSSKSFNSELTDERIICEIKSKIDDFTLPESTKANMRKGIRTRPKENDKDVVYHTLKLPERNDEFQVDSEVSDLDVELNTDKKKFKKSPVTREYTDNIRINNNYMDSQPGYSEISSFIAEESSYMHESQYEKMDLIQEDSMMYPTKFDLQPANSDDEGSFFESLKRNANFLSTTSSDEEDNTINSIETEKKVVPVKQRSIKPPSPFKERSASISSNNEVVDKMLSSSSDNSKRHRDRTVTKGRITLFKLSSSSDEDEEETEGETSFNESLSGIQERGIRFDNLNNNNNNNNKINDNRQRTERAASNKSPNYYFDGNVILKLTIVEARNLPQNELVHLDSYCAVSIGDNKRIQKTKVFRSSTSPIWDEQFTFNYNINNLFDKSNLYLKSGVPNSSKQNGVVLHIKVFNEDKFSGNKEIAYTDLDIKEFQYSKCIDRWARLTPSSDFKTGGEIHFILTINPKMARFYDDNSNYILSPKAKTPSVQINPFIEQPKLDKSAPKPKQQISKQPKTSNSKSNESIKNTKTETSQTPTFKYEHPWTDSLTEDSTTEDINPKAQDEAVILSLADEELDEKEDSEMNSEEDQNGFHTEIPPTNNNPKITNEILETNDDSDDLSPIEPTLFQNEDAENSLNLISLPADNVKKNNSQNIDDDTDEDYDEPSINQLNEFNDEDSGEMTPTSSGNVEQFDDDNSYY